MNKVILGLILAVCILGMALVMLNERLGKKNEPPLPNTPLAESGYFQDAASVTEKIDLPSDDLFNSEKTKTAIQALEQERAKEALEDHPTIPSLPKNELNDGAEKEAFKMAAEVQLPDEAKKAAPVEALPDITPAAPKTLPETSAAIPERNEEPNKQQLPKTASQKPQESVVTPPKAKPEQEALEKSRPSGRLLETKPDGAKINEVKKFVIYARENGATVRINGNRPMSWRSMVLENPPRLVLDLDGEWRFPANPGVPKNELINAVRVGKPAANKTRIVIDLKNKPKSSRVIAAKDGDGLDVRVDK